MEKVLPKGWVGTDLDTVVSRMTNGSGLKQLEEPYEGSFPISRIETIWNETIDLTRVKYVSPTEEEIEKYKLLKGDVLFSHINSDKHLGKTAVFNLEETVLHGINLLLLRSCPQYDGYFLNYLLRHYRFSGRFIEVAQRSVNQSSINQKKLKSFQVPLPPLTEQKRIVAKLDSLFASLENTKTRLEKIPKLIKNFKQAVLTQAVTGKLTEQWREGKELEEASAWRKSIIQERQSLGLPKRTPGLVYEEVEGSVELPSKWTFSYLQNFGEFTRGKSKHRPRNDKKLFGGSYPFIQTGEVARSNGLILNYTNTYSDFGLSQSRLFPKGTLCITIAANIAETGILNFDACFPDSVVGYLPYKDLYSTQFAMYYLRVIQKDLEHYAPATAQKNINLGILFEVPFPVPPKLEQTEIVRRVESLFAKADAIEAQYQSLKQKIDTLPQAILAKAFRGELVEQNPLDEPASVLLEKIKALRNAEVKIKPKRKTVRKKKIKVAEQVDMSIAAEPKVNYN